jgi:hypothetical protein
MTTRRRQRPVWRFAALALAGTLVGCDLGGPSAPTRALATVTGSPMLGAAVVDLAWPGVMGIEGRGSTQVYSGAVSNAPNRHRVILVGAEGGDLRFTVELDDLRLYGPVVTVVSAVGTDNLPIDHEGLRVVLEREAQ